jgi:hypothetical protein
MVLHLKDTQVLDIMETEFTKDIISTFNFTGPWNLEGDRTYEGMSSAEDSADNDIDNFFKPKESAKDPFEDSIGLACAKPHECTVVSEQRKDDVCISFKILDEPIFDVKAQAPRETSLEPSLEPWPNIDGPRDDSIEDLIKDLVSPVVDADGDFYLICKGEDLYGYLNDSKKGQEIIDEEIDKEADKYKGRYEISIGTLDGETKLSTKKLGYIVNGFQKTRVKYRILKVEMYDSMEGSRLDAEPYTKYVIRKDGRTKVYADDLSSAKKAIETLAKEEGAKSEIPGSSKAFFRTLYDGSEIQVCIQYIGLLINSGITTLCVFDIVPVKKV